MKKYNILLLHILVLYACNSSEPKGSEKVVRAETFTKEKASASTLCSEEKNVPLNNSFCFVAESFCDIAYLYDKPNGKIVDTLYASTEKDYYVSVELIGFSSEYAFVKASYIFDIPDTLTHIGWIETANLGIYVSKSAGNENETVRFYSSPDLSSEIVDSLPNPIWGDTFRVSDCKDGWIQTIFNGKKCWISPNNQEYNNAMPSCM